MSGSQAKKLHYWFELIDIDLYRGQNAKKGVKYKQCESPCYSPLTQQRSQM